MLFDRNFEPRCEYCGRGTNLGRDEVVCLKSGVMNSAGFCRSFRYEPTKRIPAAAPNLDYSGLSGADFSL